MGTWLADILREATGTSHEVMVRCTRPPDMKTLEPQRCPSCLSENRWEEMLRRRPADVQDTGGEHSSDSDNTKISNEQAKTARYRQDGKRRGFRAILATRSCARKLVSVHLCERCAFDPYTSGVTRGMQPSLQRHGSLRAATTPRSIWTGRSETLGVQIGREAEFIWEPHVVNACQVS